jgi:Ribonuclease G/E
MVAIDAAIVSANPGETRIALLADGQVVEFIVDRGAPARGDVIEGRVVEVAPRLNAAFIDIGEPLPAFLGKPGGFSVGASARVEIAVAARPGKGAEVKLAAAGAQPIRRTPLARALAAYPAITRVTVDDRATLPEARVLCSDATYDAQCFTDSGAADAFDEALLPRVALPEGATLDFAETAAATVIDVDGGGLAPAAANVAAIPAIARQLRLRGIAGHILIDIIPTKDRHRLMRLVQTLRAAVAEDPAPAQVAGHTPLGMIEMTRRRHGPSQAEIMLDPATRGANPLTVALDGVRVLLREAAARPTVAQALVLPPRALTELRARAAVMAEAERRLSRPLVLVERRGIETFAIEDQAR